MPGWLVQVYFVVFGLASACAGVALLIDLRGFGKHWEDDLNRHAADVGKLARLPWPANPYLGPTYRPVAGIFAMLLGLAMVAAVLFGAIR